MDDDSPYGLKSPLSSSDFESPSTARRLKKKKKLRTGVNKRIAVSNESSSSDSDEIITRPSRELRNRNGKVPLIDSSSESEASSNFRSGKNVQTKIQSTSSDTSIKPTSSAASNDASLPSCSKQMFDTHSSSDSPILKPHKKSKALVIGSSDDSSPDISAGPSRRRTRNIISESPSTSSDSQNSSTREAENANVRDPESCQAMSTDDEGPIEYVRPVRKDNTLSSTESSDEDDSPTCAICLSSLVNRIAAEISGCSHEFHNTCILKWAERTNTCPIDRSTFNKITVKNKQGKIVKVTDVEDKSAVVEEDTEMFLPDNCVVCGNSNNEDVLLLCDGCNRGFHIYCLNPPLDRVPEGTWICVHCSPVITLSDSLYLSDDLDITIENYSDSNMTDLNGSENEVSDSDQPSTSTRRSRTRNSRYRSASTLSVSVSSRNQNVSRNTRIRQTTITIKQTRKRRKRRNRRRRNQRSTVSSRSRVMAAAIAKRSSVAGCSDTPNAEARQRMRTIKSEPGRPRLSLFSSDNFEDYYNPGSDGSDAEPGSSGVGGVAVTARTRYPTSRVMDRKSAVARLINTNRRPRLAPRVTVPSVSTSPSVNILDDIMGIMDIENKKSTEKIPIKKDGTFALPEKIDVNSDKNKEKVTETPRYPRGGNPTRPRAQYGGPPGGYQNPGARHQSGVFSSRGMTAQFPPRFSNFGGSRPGSDNFSFFRSPQPRFRPNTPRFPTRRSLPASLLIEPENEPEDSSQADEDVDIYGDIDSTPLVSEENVTLPTLEPPPQPPPGLFDLGPPPEPPADLLNLGSPEEGPSDEDKGLIIDDNEYDPADPCNSPEPIEDVPSISSDSTTDELGTIPIPEGDRPIHSCAPPPPGHVIEIDSDEECPNSSLYSSTSLAFARNKAKSFTDDPEECDHNGVENKDEDKDLPKKNSVAVKAAPIRFSIGNKNPILNAEPQKKFDLFSSMEDDEEENEESDDELNESEQVNDKEMRDPSSDKEMKDTIELTEVEPIEKEGETEKEAAKGDTDTGEKEIKSKEEKLESVNVIEKKIEEMNGDNDIEDVLSSPAPEDDEQTNSVIDLNPNSSKDDSLELSSLISNKDIEKSLEEEIFGSEKGDENELDKDEVSTQGDILDLNTENLQGVTDITLHEGSLQEADKFEDEQTKKSDSFNCLDGLDVDPVSDSEYGSLSDNAEVDEDKNKAEKKKKKKRKNTDREEGEIVEPKKKDRKKSKDENNENGLGEKKSKRKKDKDLAELSPLQEKTLSNNKENFDKDLNESVAWKKLSKNTKDRNYRDKDESKNKKKKEARKEIERYNVRKVVGDKAFQRKDEFGRDISLSRSQSPVMARSPPRKRSLSRERSRSPVRKTKKRRTRSRSMERFGNSKRSYSRSPVRPRKRSRSPSFVKMKERKMQKNRGRSRSRSRRRSRTPKKARSLSRSKQKRRSRSREKARGKNKKDKNQDMIPAYKNMTKKKKKKQQRSRSWSKTKRKSKSPRARSPWDFSSTSISRSPSPAPFARKSRSWSRDNNLTVIVPNTKKKDKKKNKENKRRKHKDDHSPTLSKEVFTSGDNILVSVNFAHAEKPASENAAAEKVKGPTKRSKKDIQAMKAAKVREIAAKAKPVAIIDLDVSPFRERTPSPKEVIVLCDSDSENGESSAKASELKASSGPKTPPEPHIKFSISSKNQTIGAIANPLLDIDDNKGPNTPPDPPSPLPTSPYDPFDPTKSRSPSPVSQSAANEGDLKIVSDGHEKNQLDLLKPVTPIKDSTASPSKVSNMDDGISNLNSNSKLDDKLVTSSMSATLPSLPIYTPAMTTNSTRNMNGESNMEDILNIDSDGVYSPASSIGDDLFDPPKKSPPPASKKFDSLFVPKNAPAKSIPYEPKHTKSNSLGTVPKKNLKYTPTKTTKSKNATTISKLDEDQLKILDEVPSSAVEMQVKYKYLKKLNRQERVVEEVKIVLKPHYNKKHVTKEQYKDILRKSVPKICHNKSGEINPSKIHQLVEAYVKKYRIQNKRAKNNAGSGTNATANSNAAHNNANAANNTAAKKGKSMWS